MSTFEHLLNSNNSIDLLSDNEPSDSINTDTNSVSV